MSLLIDGLTAKAKAGIAGGIFLAGTLFGGFAVGKIWNGVAKDRKIKTLSSKLEASEGKAAAQELQINAFKAINLSYELAIKTKDGEILNYAAANTQLALSRAPSKETIYKEGQAIADQESSKPGNECLASIVNERLRLYANGELDNASRLPPFSWPD